MKYFTNLLAITSLATLVLSGVVRPLNSRNVQISAPQDITPLATSSLESRGVQVDLEDRGIAIGCLANVYRLITINRNGRRDISEPLHNLETWQYDPNGNIHVNLDFTHAFEPRREVRFAISNRSQFLTNALILSNYADTAVGTPRATVRISIPRAQGVSFGTPAPITITGCVHLERLDGTWYVQLEN